MDQETLNKYFECINIKTFCKKYDIWYEHFVKVLNGKEPMGIKVEQNVQTSILCFHDDLIELSETLMQKPKKKKSKKVLQSL